MWSETAPAHANEDVLYYYFDLQIATCTIPASLFVREFLDSIFS